MRAVWLCALAVSAPLACAPLPDASAPAEDELPCRTDEDCAMAGRETGPRSQLCTSRGINLHTPKDVAACGPMPNMTPMSSEPTLACFRGTCVPIQSR